MAPEVYVKSVTFKETPGSYGLASVQMHLSDGTSSPEVKTNWKDHAYDETICLNEERPVRTVSACRNKVALVYNMQFKDGDGRSTGGYNPIGEPS